MLSPLLPPSNDSEASVFKVFDVMDNCENMHAFHSLWWFFKNNFGNFSLCYVCYFWFDLIFFVRLCEMFLGFGIIRLINSHMAWDTGLSTVGVWVFCGSEWGHVLSLSFFLCPDPITSLFSWCIWFFSPWLSLIITGLSLLFFSFPRLSCLVLFFLSSVGFRFLVCSCK